MDSKCSKPTHCPRNPGYPKPSRHHVTAVEPSQVQTGRRAQADPVFVVDMEYKVEGGQSSGSCHATNAHAWKSAASSCCSDCKASTSDIIVNMDTHRNEQTSLTSHTGTQATYIPHLCDVHPPVSWIHVVELFALPPGYQYICWVFVDDMNLA